jgi:hypothetical protein
MWEEYLYGYKNNLYCTGSLMKMLKLQYKSCRGSSYISLIIFKYVCIQNL